MRLSTKGRYGVRAMFDLALYYNEGAISLKNVASRQEISEKYLEHLFSSLKKSGLINSIRGAQGGYRLAKPPGEITIGDIIRVLEGPIAPVECVEENEEGICDRSCNCAIQSVWFRVRDKLNEVLDDVTLEDVCEDYSKYQNQGYMYYI